MNHTVAISIGRNIGSTPMGPDRWDDFLESVRDLLSVEYSTAFGSGRWVDPDGVEVVEESAIILGVVGDPGSVRSVLAELAVRFEQDGIGLLVVEGTDTVVEGVAR
jgi:hypothetical protein